MLICATTGMGPMLSDSSQTQKATYLLYASTSRKSTEQAKGRDRNLMSACLRTTGVRWGKLQEGAVGSECLAGTGVSLCGGANVLDTVVMVAQHCQCTLGATGWSAAFSVQRSPPVGRERSDKDRVQWAG